MSGRRIDMSATHVAASLFAAVTGAVAASSLGVGGTLIGAAIASVASTAGVPVCKHYLTRSHERLRKAAVVPAPPAGPSGAARHPNQQRAQGDSARMAGDRARTAPESARPARPSSPDYQATEVFPAVSDHARRWSADLSGDGAAWDSAGMAWTGGDSAELAGGAWDSAEMAWTGQDSAGKGQDSAGTIRKMLSSRRSIVLAGIALAVFLIAMGGITVFELAAGKPISSVLFHHGGSGTTIGDYFGGHARRPSAPAKPAPTTPGSTGRATGTPSPSVSPSQSPTLTCLLYTSDAADE